MPLLGVGAHHHAKLRIQAALSFPHHPEEFRRQLERLITAPGGDSIVLCSGYVWQPDEASGILQDGLLEAIINGVNGHPLTTVAGKLDTEWLQHYRNFVRLLRNEGLTVNAYLAPRRNWHAKIALRMSGSTPIAALVGSSNLTFPAHSEGRPNWNFECDVAIWRPSQELTDHFRGREETEDRSNAYPSLCPISVSGMRLTIKSPGKTSICHFPPLATAVI